MRCLSLILAVTMMTAAIGRADDAPWAMEFGFDAAAFGKGPVGEMALKMAIGDFKTEMDKMTKETGFELKDIAYASLGYKTVSVERFQKPPSIVLEMNDVATVAKAVKNVKAIEIVAKGNVKGLPNASIHKLDATKNGAPFYLVEGSIIAFIGMDSRVDSPDDEMIADGVACIGNHAKVKATMTKAKSHLYGNVDAAVMNMLKQFPLPPQAGTFKPLMEAQNYTMHMTADKKVSLDLRGKFVNAKDADEAKEAIDATLGLATIGLSMLKAEMQKDANAKDLMPLHAMLVTLHKGAKAKLEDTSVVIKTEAAVPENLAEIVGNMMKKVRGSADRMQSQNNLKQMGLAFHNYHDAMRTFPSNIYSSDATPKPLLSWRVHLLPYIEQDNLYREFKLDEAWDSDHNKKLIAKMPKVYLHPESKAKDPGMTHYRAFGNLKKDEALKCMIPSFPGEKFSFRNVTDGTSNTIMFVEAADAVIWTKPDSLPFDPNGKLPKLGGLLPGGFNAALGDGSVRFLKDTISEKTLKALITANGGEVVTIDE